MKDFRLKRLNRVKTGKTERNAKTDRHFCFNYPKIKIFGKQRPMSN